MTQFISLPLSWTNLFLNCISLGNQIYDSVTRGVGRYFSVRDASAFLSNITGDLELEDSFDLSILSENPAVPQSSLAFYLRRLTQEENLAGIVIMNGITISLVGMNNEIIIMDSHLHGYVGAMISFIKEFALSYRNPFVPCALECLTSVFYTVIKQSKGKKPKIYIF